MTQKITQKAYELKLVLKSSKSVLIDFYYRPREESKYLINNFREVFEEQLTNVVTTKKEIIILDDFNIVIIKQIIETLILYLTSSDLKK